MSPAPSIVISLGCDAGGPEAAFFASLKIPLACVLAQHVTSSHYAEIDEYALVLRVDGSIAKFGEKGLARMRLSRAKCHITIDIQIPEPVWHIKTEQELMSYLARQVTVAAAYSARLKKEKWAVTEQELMAQLQAAEHDYLADKMSANPALNTNALQQDSLASGRRLAPCWTSRSAMHPIERPHERVQHGRRV